MSNYYTPRNQALNPTIRTERPYPILTVENYLRKAIDAGIIAPKISLDEVCTDMRMLVVGVVFDWCLRYGGRVVGGDLRRSIGHYLDGIF